MRNVNHQSVERIRTTASIQAHDLCDVLEERTAFYSYQWFESYKQIRNIGYNEDQSIQLLKELGTQYMSPKMCVDVAAKIWTDYRGLE